MSDLGGDCGLSWRTEQGHWEEAPWLFRWFLPPELPQQKSFSGEIRILCKLVEAVLRGFGKTGQSSGESAEDD